MNGRGAARALARIRNAAEEIERETAFSPNGPHLPVTIKLRYPNTHATEGHLH